MKKKRDEYSKSYRIYFPMVFNTVFTKVGDRDAAEDICQEIFIAYYDKFNEIDNHRKWLNGTIRNMVMKYCNAGHFPPFIYRRETDEFIALEASGKPLGWLKTVDLEEKQITLKSGDRIILYTDGLTEGANYEREEFGSDREQIRLALEAENIESRPVWKPMHLQPVFDCKTSNEDKTKSRFGCRTSDIGPRTSDPKRRYPARAVGGEVAEDLFNRGLCLPSGTAMTESDLDRICSIIRSCHRP